MVNSGIIVLLNLMSFLKSTKLENYTQIFIQFHISFTKRPEVDTVYNKEKIKWNARLLKSQLNENWTLSKLRKQTNEWNNCFIKFNGFLKSTKLENYIRIFIQFHLFYKTSRSRHCLQQREVRLLKLQLNENLNANVLLNLMNFLKSTKL